MNQEFGQLAFGFVRGGAVAAAVAVVIFSPTGASARSLTETMQETYLHSAAVRASEGALAAAASSEIVARAGFLPKVSATGSYNHLDRTSRSTLVDAFDREDSLTQMNASISVEQPLFNGLQNFYDLARAKANMSAARADHEVLVQDTLLAAARAHLDVVRGVELVRLARRNVEFIGRQLEEAGARYANGEATRTDVAQAQASLARAVAGRANAMALLESDRARYRAVSGLEPVNLQAASARYPHTPETLTAALEIARLNAPVLAAARARATASEKDVKSARGALMPSVTAFANYAFRNKPSIAVDETETIAYGVRVDAPLFDGGANYGRLKQSRARRLRDQWAVRQEEADLDANVQTAWANLVSARLVTVSAAEEFRAARAARDGVQAELLAGERTTQDLLTAEQAAFETELQLIGAHHDAYFAALSLLASVGLLNDAVLGSMDMR